MRVCGVEIKGREAIICLMSMSDGVFDIPDCRVRTMMLTNDEDQESVQKFHFAFSKLMEDYKVDHIVIKPRQTKGKFAGSSTGFKIEAALQLIDSVETYLMPAQQMKALIKRNPLPVDFRDTELKKMQQTAFEMSYAYLNLLEYGDVPEEDEA